MLSGAGNADNPLEVITALKIGGDMPTLALTPINLIPEEDTPLRLPATNGFVHD